MDMFWLFQYQFTLKKIFWFIFPSLQAGQVFIIISLRTVFMVKLVVLVSGKRKSGKDYCCEKLKAALEPLKVSIHGVSHSLKAIYAETHGLDYSQLISDGPYKESHRLEMINWGENVRDNDPSFFCRATIPSSCEDDIVIISDCRRPTDIDYFQSHYRTLTVRVEAHLKEREKRGFVFVTGIDDMPSECALDGYDHDVTIVNDHSRVFSSEIANVVWRIRNSL
ncbi:unnamed protein product [Cylicocyclus nassatus]|uniref:Phosphomevalonate kinase n=1 Tax=Cylicocyclus nassatus TaxID=53992 RepID=A0AA36DMI5_CYLNA|nr:unnamed protein product [Cylicocyclus nassatus]